MPHTKSRVVSHLLLSPFLICIDRLKQLMYAAIVFWMWSKCVNSQLCFKDESHVDKIVA